MRFALVLKTNYIRQPSKGSCPVHLTTTVHCNNLLENVEHCGGEPEQADRILITQ